MAELRRASCYDLRVAQHQVHQCPYFIIRVDDADRIVRIWRSSEPFPHLSAVHAGWQSVIHACNKIGRVGRCQLLDMRLAPARNDPEFEKTVTALLPAVHAGFLRNAVLAKLAVGALQIRRLAKSDGIERLITSSEDEALRYLKEVL